MVFQNTIPHYVFKNIMEYGIGILSGIPLCKQKDNGMPLCISKDNGEHGGGGVKGKIDKYGTLYIERAGKMKDQLCPYCSECGSPIACSDTCPLFGEPRPESGTFSVMLELCQGKKLFFDVFNDERVVE